MRFSPEIYAQELARFIQEKNELALSNAYALGRLAIADGVSLTELLQIHFKVTACAEQCQINDCLPFLREAVAPYDMSLRGYQEATESLRLLNNELNAEVERRTQELWNAQESLRQAEKFDSLGRMAGGISHDFNNILSVILTYTAIMASELPSDSPLRDDLAEISAAAQRGSSLTKQLLAFSRQQSIDQQDIEVRSALTELAKFLQRVLPDNIELALSLPAENLYINLGKGQLEQVVMNLVLNARDAMPTGGNVELSLSEIYVGEAQAENLAIAPGYYARLRVVDTGIGMVAEVMDKIFEPFYTTKGTRQGTGLGLATVLGIARKNSGALEVASKLNQGSVFTVYFPVTTGTTSPEETSQKPYRPATGKILYVEDDKALRNGMVRYLRDTGFEVFEAENGSVALSVLNENQGLVSLVVTDMLMPAMGGVELHDEVRKRWPKIRFLFTSGYFEHEALPAEAVHFFLQKPFEPHQLLHRIEELLLGP